MAITANWKYIILEWPADGVYRMKRRGGGKYTPPVHTEGIDTITDSNSWQRAVPDKQLTYMGNQYDFFFWYLAWQYDDTDWKAAPESRGERAVNLDLPEGANYTITAVAYFIRNVGVGSGDHGIFLDAFDLALGDFIPDDFVEVEKNTELTKAANNGYINTSKLVGKPSGFKLTALRDLNLNLFASVRVPFKYWRVANVLVNGVKGSSESTQLGAEERTLQIHQNDIIYGLAFYRRQPVKPPKGPNAGPAEDPWWSIRTHGGLVPPGHDPSDWFTIQLSEVVSLLDNIRNLPVERQVKAMDAVKKRLSGVKEEIKRLR